MNIDQRLDTITAINGIREGLLDNLETHLRSTIENFGPDPEMEAYILQVMGMVEDFTEDYLDDIDGEALAYCDYMVEHSCEEHSRDYYMEAKRIREERGDG